MTDRIISVGALEISIQERPNDFCARLVRNPGIWGLGKSEKEAIGDLIITLESFKDILNI